MAQIKNITFAFTTEKA